MSNFAWYRFREEKEMFQRKSVGRVKKKVFGEKSKEDQKRGQK